MLEEILAKLIPFLFLSPAEREDFAARSEERIFSDGDWILRQGSAGDRRLFILVDGEVEVFDEANGLKLTGAIEKGRYFGERGALFETPRSHSVRARGQVKVAIFSGEDFVDLLARCPAIAHALGNIMRERQGLFKAFDAFMAELLMGVNDDLINFRALRRRYIELCPALHGHVKDEHIIDFEALTYASSRLPDGITRAYMLYLTDTLDHRIENTVAGLTIKETRARRRAVYEMAPGKLMVILRDGVSDLIDFVTCLCAFATEARKIRYRLLAPHRMDRLTQIVAKPPESRPDATTALLSLGFDEHEASHFTRLWPEDVIGTLYEISLHHEDYNVQVTKQLQGYNAQHAEIWTSQIAAAVRSLTGHPSVDLPPDLPVHIISSNTHSIHNCLSPFLRHHRAEIEMWGEEHRPELFELDWVDSEDLLYALTRDWLRAHPERVAERDREDREGGMIRLGSTALTGISVELIDLSRLDVEGIDDTILIDGSLCEKGLLVNIDYAFGQQAEEILAILLQLFGRNVRSVNILGKAGALVGERGDILVADAFVEQTQDLLEPLRSINAIDLARLAARVPDRRVHYGPVLTVAGTLLQNDVLLRFYKHIWQCIGLEMEGTYYLRELLKARHLGIIPEDVEMRFVYYVSDVPLSPGETLAGALRPEEGIPPLYAITREILSGVLSA